VETLLELIPALPRDLAAAVFIVLHVPPDAQSFLPQILERRGKLSAAHAVDGEPIHKGHIYIAPPDRHLLVDAGQVRVIRGPRENASRPAVDPLFRTAARAYGRRVCGVILSGNLDDGTAGLAAIKARGGVAIVQDPDEAMYQGMPRSAIENVVVDKVLPLREIAPALVELAAERVDEIPEPALSKTMDIEANMAEMDPQAMAKNDRPGTPSAFTCPECGGTLWELAEGEIVRYRCRVGHAYSVEHLLAAESQAVEAALWSAMAALKEKSTLARRMLERARERQHAALAKRLGMQAETADRHAETLRQLISTLEGHGGDGQEALVGEGHSPKVNSSQA